MPEYSNHYNLIKLLPGERLSEDAYAFTKRNIDSIDHKLYLGAEGHIHDGAEPAVVDPTDQLQLEVVTGSGNIPSGITVFYKYTWVDQYGAETGPSVESSITTPTAIQTPQQPTLAKTSSGGALLPGAYFYVLSAYVDTINQETVGSNRGYITILAGTSNLITLTLPSLPTGADGFNVYRKSPGSSTFHYLDSIDMAVATPPTIYEDDGSLTEDCNRIVPRSNTTSSGNSVVVTLPGSTPTVPLGYTWKIYRTYMLNQYDSSLLHWVVEETSEGSGIVTATYTDVGASRLDGKYPSVSEIVGSPDKVLLTDGAEVQGFLPGNMTDHVAVVNFGIDGPIHVEDGTFVWPVPFPQCYLKAAMASLGDGSSPSADPVQIDINKSNGGATPTYSSIIDVGPFEIEVGYQTSAAFTSFTSERLFAEGDTLRIDVVQEGGGATPNDYDLTVALYFVVHDTSVSGIVWA